MFRYSLSDPDLTIPFTVYTDTSYKQASGVISQNNKPIVLFSRGLINTQRTYTISNKELIVIVECLNQFCGILFDYEINLFPYHKNLVYAATLSESQRVMLWKLILKYFGPNIKHNSGVDNIGSIRHCTLKSRTSLVWHMRKLNTGNCHFSLIYLPISIFIYIFYSTGESADGDNPGGVATTSNSLQHH